MNQTERTQVFDVAIAGASFAGLSLAVALSTALGPIARIALIDRAGFGGHSDTPDARAFALAASSKRMLETLGLWSGIADEAEPVTAIDISDSSLRAGVRPFLLSYDNTVDAGEPASYIVPHQVLANALTARVAALPNVDVLAATTIRGFTIEEPFARIDFHERESLAAALLVAADGGQSALRAAAGINVVGWGYKQTGIVATLRHELPHLGRAVQHFLPGGPFAILPLRGGHRSCVTWTERAEEARRILALDDAAFREEIETRVTGRLGALHVEGPRQSWPLSMHVARAYASRRFVLIGDAAHSVHPIAGQGVNLAFRDVAALTEVVADAARLGLDAGDSAALERYERWRRFDSAVAAATFDGLNRLFSNDIALLRSAREAGLGVVNRLPGLKDMLVRQAAGVSGELPRLLKGEPV